MAIKVDDADFFIAQMATDAPHRGETDGVVAAQQNRERPRCKHMGHALGNLVEGFFVVGRNREADFDGFPTMISPILGLVAFVTVSRLTVRPLQDPEIQSRDLAESLRSL